VDDNGFYDDGVVNPMNNIEMQRMPVTNQPSFQRMPLMTQPHFQRGQSFSTGESFNGLPMEDSEDAPIVGEITSATHKTDQATWSPDELTKDFIDNELEACNFNKQFRSVSGIIAIMQVLMIP